MANNNIIYASSSSLVDCRLRTPNWCTDDLGRRAASVGARGAINCKGIVIQCRDKGSRSRSNPNWGVGLYSGRQRIARWRRIVLNCESHWRYIEWVCFVFLPHSASAAATMAKQCFLRWSAQLDMHYGLVWCYCCNEMGWNAMMKRTSTQRLVFESDSYAFSNSRNWESYLINLPPQHRTSPHLIGN